MIKPVKILLLNILLISGIPGFAQYGYQAYFGNLHSHTGNSDGEGTPEEAYNFARDSAGLDFLAVTDHVEQIDPIEWYNQITTANQQTANGSYVALIGYEWGSPLDGHINVFNTNNLILTLGWFYDDWDGFRQWVIDNPPAFTEFNHPGDPSYATTWNDFEYLGGDNDSIFRLMEFQSPQQATDWYEFALKKGWHLSPVWNQDNHSADWGTKDNGRAGIWATELTKTALYEAIKKRRTFATTDKNASIWLDISGVPMGGTVQKEMDAPVHISLVDGNNESWSNIEMVSQNGIIDNFSSTTSSLDTILLVTPGNDEWIFIRARQPDGDYIWSAPVHFTGTINVGVHDIPASEFSYSPNPANDMINVSFTGVDEDKTYLYIVNDQGQIVKELRPKNHSERNGIWNFSVSDVAPGLYFLNLYSGGSFTFKKLIIQR